MGCDIHWNSETKRDGVWVCDQEIKQAKYGEPGEMALEDLPGRGRDYWWFGLIAKGVRSTWDWSFDYQDQIPEDLSPEVAKRVEDDGSDGHSHGTLTRAELKEKLEEFKPIRAEYLIAPPEGDDRYLVEAAAHLSERLEEVIGYLTSDVPDEDQRIMFWFDN